jgi:hypothetical protein
MVTTDRIDNRLNDVQTACFVHGTVRRRLFAWQTVPIEWTKCLTTTQNAPTASSNKAVPLSAPSKPWVQSSRPARLRSFSLTYCWPVTNAS